MARQYGKRKKNEIITLYGFEEWAENIQRAVDTDVDTAIEKCFEKCADIVDNSLEEQMQKANVPASLRAKKSVLKEHRGNLYVFSDGWLKRDEESFNHICYLNYGTPKRYTRNNAYRGKIQARYFISNAKRSAAQKVKKAQKDALKEIMEGIER